MAISLRHATANLQLIPLCQLILIAVAAANDFNLPLANKKQDTRKCCELSEILVEEHPGQRKCISGDKIGHPSLLQMNWKSLPLKDFAITHGDPICEDGEHLVPLYHHPRDANSFELLVNGSLLFKSAKRGPLEFNYVKYCVEKVLVSHNYSHIDEGDIADFANVCMDIRQSVREIVELYVFPIGIAVSMSCLTLTFLLYALLPQLRDLTGKFILGICAFLTASYSLRLVDSYASDDPNINNVAIEIVQHSSIVGAWLCLNSMGHHVWKVIMSKSVFTRVTDGQRCCYYSSYLLIVMGVVVSVATAIFFLVEEESPSGRRYHLGFATLSVFYIPVLLLLIINLFFYWNCQHQIGKQLVYNRSMQHFQINFDLFSKLFMVIGSCWLFQTLAYLDYPFLYYIGAVFAIIQGPLIFLVAMCRTRVAFLFKKYFCKDGCCNCIYGGNSEFIELASSEVAAVDKIKERLEDRDGDEAHVSLMDRWADVNGTTKDREMSKSLMNVRTNRHDITGESAIMKVGRMLKANSVNLAAVNFGWRKETSV